MVDAVLDVAAARGRPVAMAGTRQLGVRGALGGLFPAGGLQRGSVVEVGGTAAMSLSLMLVAGLIGSSGWAAAVGFPSLGLVAAAELGVPLDRLALVPSPGERMPEVVAALLDGVDLLLVSPPVGLRPSDARRLAARARERATVLVPVRHGGAARWPESPDLLLEARGTAWYGLGCGHGILRSRRVEVALSGRRVARPRSTVLGLPGPGGRPEEVPPVVGDRPPALTSAV